MPLTYYDKIIELESLRVTGTENESTETNGTGASGTAVSGTGTGVRDIDVELCRVDRTDMTDMTEVKNTNNIKNKDKIRNPMQTK